MKIQVFLNTFKHQIIVQIVTCHINSIFFTMVPSIPFYMFSIVLYVSQSSLIRFCFHLLFYLYYVWFKKLDFLPYGFSHNLDFTDSIPVMSCNMLLCLLCVL